MIGVPRQVAMLALGLLFAVATGALVRADPLPPNSTSGAPPTLPGILGRDDRVILDSSRWPWLALGRVNRRGGGFCTGILVTPNAVLTAAHCLYDQRTRRRVRPEELHFLAGYRRGEFEALGTAVAITTPWQDPDRPPASLEDAGKDWAILQLRDRLTIRPIGIQPLPVGDQSPTSLPITGVLNAGYARNRPHLLSLHERCTISGREPERGILFHTCDSTFGESGSPLLMRRGEDFFVVALAVATTGVGPSARNVAVDADRFANVVRRVSEDARPSAAVPPARNGTEAGKTNEDAQ